LQYHNVFYNFYFFRVRRNSSDAEKFYKMAVELDDSHANNLCNYGLFLRYLLPFGFISSLFFCGSEEKGNFEQAELLYKYFFFFTIVFRYELIHFLFQKSFGA
jgi:TPR repeat protein